MSTISIPIEGSASVAEASELFATVRDAITSQTPVEFQLEHATAIDASILQILLAAKAAAREKGIACTVTGVTDGMRASLVSSGAGEHLALEEQAVESEATAESEANADSEASLGETDKAESEASAGPTGTCTASAEGSVVSEPSETTPE